MKIVEGKAGTQVIGLVELVVKLSEGQILDSFARIAVGERLKVVVCRGCVERRMTEPPLVCIKGPVIS